VYVAIDLLGRIHSCGTDLSNHVIGHMSRPMDEEAYMKSLEKLHDKGDWVIRCFDCDAKKICRYSCPTSDHNSDNYKEFECHYTKLLYRHLCENPDKAERIGAVMRARRSPQEQFVPLTPLASSPAVLTT
jgi:radical SAM protein with 4Fe4S-binding SPASM domain